MVSDREIYRSAKVLVDRYGPAAETLARDRVESWTRQGAIEGAAVWRRIKAAVHELQDQKSGGGKVN